MSARTPSCFPPFMMNIHRFAFHSLRQSFTNNMCNFRGHTVTLSSRDASKCRRMFDLRHVISHVYSMTSLCTFPTLTVKNIKEILLQLNI